MIEDITINDYRYPRRQFVRHAYACGDRLRIYADGYLYARLKMLCSQRYNLTRFNLLVKEIYTRHFQNVLPFLGNAMCESAEISRMAADKSLKLPQVQMSGPGINRKVKYVLWDLARAGVIPTLRLYEMLNQWETDYALMNGGEAVSPARHDFLMIARQENEVGGVAGATLFGSKYQTDVAGKIVLLADPMGATGSSAVEAINLLKDNCTGAPQLIATINCIITPEYVHALTTAHPEVHIHAIRLDRGAGPLETLQSVPGSDQRESGLNKKGYIVPGGGGFGECMTNCWV